MQQEEIFSNREHHTHLQAELKLKTAQFDGQQLPLNNSILVYILYLDRVLYEKQKAKETCRDTEEQKEAEVFFAFKNTLFSTTIKTQCMHKLTSSQIVLHCSLLSNARVRMRRNTLTRRE